MGDALSEIFDDLVAASPENLFTILEPLQDTNGEYVLPFSMFEEPIFGPNLIETVARMPPREYSNVVNGIRRRYETDEEEEDGGGVRRKKMKLVVDEGVVEEDGLPKVSHITVERNRRKQMNEHLVVLRSLMPCFYVKRGDQASIIGGVVDYIKELQQLLKSLEAKKQRKVYSEVLSSPRPPLSSPRPLASPRPPPPLPPSPHRPSPLCSPRVSPGTPQPVIMSPYKPKTHMNESSLDAGACADHRLAGNYRSSYRAAADVEVKLSGPNVVLKTASHRIPGQALKIITVLEGLALEILHVSISTMEDTMLFSFTIKIGIECELSAEELSQEIQQTFS